MLDDRATDVGCLGLGGMQSEKVMASVLLKRMVKSLYKVKCVMMVGVDGITVDFL